MHICLLPRFSHRKLLRFIIAEREDVLTKRPELIENKEWCCFEGEEKLVYEEAVPGKHRDEAGRVSWNVEDLNNSSKAQRLKEIVELVKEDDRKLIVFPIQRNGRL